MSFVLKFLSDHRIILGFATLSTLLLVSLIVNFLPSSAPTNSTALRDKYEEQRVPLMPKDIKINLENSSTIECQREFFLFHQDHVRKICDVIARSLIQVNGGRITFVK